MKKEVSRELSIQREVEIETLAALPSEKIDTSAKTEVLDWSDANRAALYRPVKQVLGFEERLVPGGPTRNPETRQHADRPRRVRSRQDSCRCQACVRSSGFRFCRKNTTARLLVQNLRTSARICVAAGRGSDGLARRKRRRR